MTAVKCQGNRSDCNSKDERERPGPSGRAEEREKKSAQGPEIKRDEGKWARWVKVFHQIVLLQACGRQGSLTFAFGGLWRADSQREVMICMVCK